MKNIKAIINKLILTKKDREELYNAINNGNNGASVNTITINTEAYKNINHHCDVGNLILTDNEAKDLANISLNELLNININDIINVLLKDEPFSIYTNPLKLYKITYTSIDELSEFNGFEYAISSVTGHSPEEDVVDKRVSLFTYDENNDLIFRINIFYYNNKPKFVSTYTSMFDD